MIRLLVDYESAIAIDDPTGTIFSFVEYENEKITRRYMKISGLNNTGELKKIVENMMLAFDLPRIIEVNTTKIEEQK